MSTSNRSMKNFVNNHIKLYEKEVNQNSRLLRRKLKKILANEKNNKKIITPELFTKIGLITSQMQEMTNELEDLIVLLDSENPIELTEEDKERIDNTEATKKLFTACFPYIIVQNMLLNSENSYTAN